MNVITEDDGVALDGSSNKLQVNESMCIGCGLCASHCAVDAIRMIKVRENLPEETFEGMVKRFLECDKTN